jgi:hypothetical protein
MKYKVTNSNGGFRRQKTLTKTLKKVEVRIIIYGIQTSTLYNVDV